MITVTISINGRAIITRSAVNKTPDLPGNAESTYKVDDGRTIQHARHDGAVPLAMKLLAGVHQPDLDFSDTPKDKLDEAILNHLRSLAPVVVIAAKPKRKAKK